MTTAHDPQLAEFAKRGITIPPQPKVLIELRELLGSDDYDVHSVAAVVGKDPGVLAALFRLARSPLYSRGKNVETIDQVVMLVGARQVFSLVQAVALAASLSDQAKPVFEMLWQRADMIARVASLIAHDRISICNVFPEQAFLAGMFHECGIPVMMQRYPAYCSKTALRDGGFWPDLDAEDAAIGMDHCSIGYLVARHWKLPDFICRAVLTQAELPTEELGAVASLVAILQLARQFYYRMHRKDSPHWPRIGAAVLNELCIHPAEEMDIFDKIVERFSAEN